MVVRPGTCDHDDSKAVPWVSEWGKQKTHHNQKSSEYGGGDKRNGQATVDEIRIKVTCELHWVLMRFSSTKQANRREEAWKKFKRERKRKQVGKKRWCFLSSQRHTAQNAHKARRCGRPVKIGVLAFFRTCALEEAFGKQSCARLQQHSPTMASTLDWWAWTRSRWTSLSRRWPSWAQQAVERGYDIIMRCLSWGCEKQWWLPSLSLVEQRLCSPLVPADSDVGRQTRRSVGLEERCVAAVAPQSEVKWDRLEKAGYFVTCSCAFGMLAS